MLVKASFDMLRGDVSVIVGSGMYDFPRFPVTKRDGCPRGFRFSVIVIGDSLGCRLGGRLRGAMEVRG